MSELIHELLLKSAAAAPEREALKYRADSLGYGDLAQAVEAFAGATAPRSSPPPTAWSPMPAGKTVMAA